MEGKDKAANLISVDFAKAFNRMNHFKCLEALSDLGAGEETIDWVACFLHGRTMSVKIGDILSHARSAPGGSPQGSILGNFLFCATTNKFTDLDGSPELTLEYDTSSSSSSASDHSRPARLPAYIVSTPSARGQFANFCPPQSLDNLSGEYESDEDDSFDFFRIKKRYEFDSTDSENSSIYEQVDGTSMACNIKSYVYIDDFNAVEAINLKGALSHITTNKCQLRIRAKGSENLFTKINSLAEEIGMQVNANKTQMLCIHSCVHNRVVSHILSNGHKIQSTNEMKILGFHFDTRPNANGHVEKLIE